MVCIGQQCMSLLGKRERAWRRRPAPGRGGHARPAGGARGHAEAAGDGGQALAAGPGHPLLQPPPARRPAGEDHAADAGPHRPQGGAGAARRGQGRRGLGRGVLLPRLRFRTPVLPGRPGDTRLAVRAGRADRAAAHLSVLRLSADFRRRPGQGRGHHHAEPGVVPPRRQHAELPGHQDRAGVLRHLPGPVAGVPVRQDLPRLPHPRHPRIPGGEGRETSLSQPSPACGGG